MIYTTISGHKIDITKNYLKNTYIGKYLNQTNMPTIYGDSVNEVIKEAEEMENDSDE